MMTMRAKGRRQGRFTALSGLKKLAAPPGSQYPLLVVDSTGSPVFFLCEWYRRKKAGDPGRTPDTYLDMALPWAGFLLRRGYAWNAEPDRLLAFLVEFLRDDVGCQVGADSQREDGWCVQTTGASPLSKSSLGVLLAALTSVYDTLISAGYYAYRNPMRSERLLQLKQEHLRQVTNVGAPDHAGIRSETRAETNRAFPTNQFRQRRGKVWEPQVVLEPDAVQERMRQTVDFMIQHATFQRDQVILLLVRQTGARISEIIEMTAGGYRAARHAGRALVKNKGSHGREEKTIYFTSSLERHLLSYIRTERATYDPHGRKRLEELDDGDPLFLTRTGKPYTRAAFYHHWNKLFPPAQCQFKKQEQVEFTPHDLRHLRTTRAITTLRKEASGDAATEAALLEGFQHLMGWRSPETMSTYVKTMNKRQALQSLLADEEVQEQSVTYTHIASRSHQCSPQLAPGPNGESSQQNAREPNEQGELDWYEE
ncbi:MAG TPA: site-specific integrase [Ktedonobacteraceae bacterium]|nr:site-specific integrase [Ktedonobacteraceae bacterium]